MSPLRSGSPQSLLQGQPRPGLLLCLPHPGTPVCLFLQALFHSTGLAHPPRRSTRKLYTVRWKSHFMVRRSPSRPSQLLVQIGTVLEFVEALFPTGLTHSTLNVYMAALPAYCTPLGGQSVGRHPLVTCFLQRLRPSARDLKLCGGSGCYSIASNPLLSPFLEIKTHSSEVGLRDAGPTHLATRSPFFSCHSCAPSTLGREFESLTARVSPSQCVLRPSSS